MHFYNPFQAHIAVTEKTVNPARYMIRKFDLPSFTWEHLDREEDYWWFSSIGKEYYLFDTAEEAQARLDEYCNVR